MSAIALTLGLLGGGLAVTELPASASVSSVDYTIGTPTGAVTGVSATPSTTTTGSTKSFEVSFTTPQALSGTISSWVSIASSEPLGAAPSQTDLVGGSCVQEGTTGAGGLGSATSSQVTVELGTACSIAAGSTVDVFFDAEAPTAAGDLYFSVTTSADGTPATSNAVTVASSGPVLTAVHYSFGDITTYKISDVTVGTNGGGTSIGLTSAATSGSETMTFLGTPADYQVTVTSPGGTGTTDAVQALTATGSTAVLTLASPVATGDTLAISAVGTNPAQASAPQSDNVAITVNSAAAVTTNSVTFGNSVGALTVSPSDSVAGATAGYVIKFDVSTAGTGDIFISETAGPTDFATVTAAEVVDNTQGWQTFATPTVIGGSMVEVPFGGPTYVNDAITVTLSNVTNPPAGTVSDFEVWTTNDAVPSYSAGYTISPNASPGVVVTVNPSTTSAIAAYAISNVYASSALTAGTSTISVDGPAGTIFPNDPADYSIGDVTTATSGTVTAALTGGSTNDVTLTVPDNIAGSNELTINISDALNPSTASSTDSISLGGNITGPAPTAPTTTTTTVPPTTTAPKPPVPSVSFITKTAHVTNKSVALRVYCAHAACHGSITLTDVRTIVASKSYQVAAGTSKSFTVGINSKGLSLLAKAKGKTITVTEAVSVSGGKSASRKIALIG